MKQKLIELEEEIGKYTITVRDFTVPLSIIDRTSRQKISRSIEDLNNTINQPDVTDIFRTFYPTTAEYTFFSSACAHLPQNKVSIKLKVFKSYKVYSQTTITLETKSKRFVEIFQIRRNKCISK